MNRQPSRISLTASIESGLAKLTIPIETVTIDNENARIHGDRNLAAIRDSLSSFGQQKPIVISADGVVIAGNGLVIAARDLGWTHIAAVKSNLTASAIRAYAIADNRTAELSEWDETALAGQLAQLKDMDYDLEQVGFSERELLDLLSDDDDLLDEIPPPPRNPKSKSGCKYILGQHRLFVGDAARPEDLAELMGADLADLLLTDPPYNVAYEGKTAEALTINNDSMEDAAFRQFLTDAFTAADSVMRPGGGFYIWHADSEGFNFRAACRQAGWQIRQCLVWVKNVFVLGRQDYQWRHEPCLYGWKDGAAHTWLGDRRQSTVVGSRIDQKPAGRSDELCLVVDGQGYVIRGRDLDIQPVASSVLAFDRPARNAEHPTMKPVELFAYQIRNSARCGGIVLDPFCGSGTTVIAAELTGRRGRAVEMDPRYADVIRKRWAELVHGDGCDWQKLTPVCRG